MKISTVGGNVAENSGGLRGLKYGVTRNYVMGMEVVLPDGETLWTGNKCVKDVAGYSLRDLFIGSEGTLGVITKVLLKLIPKPAAKKTMVATFARMDQAAQTVSDIIAAQIIPTDDLPGAREAGVVYFIDQALKTFASDTLTVYQKGLADLNARTGEKYPGVKQFADASATQQHELLEELSNGTNPAATRGRRGGQAGASADFFQTILQHTVSGFLIDPSGGGNRDYAGWKVIDRDPSHSFAPPFGFYDKDYPGWQRAMGAEEKK